MGIYNSTVVSEEKLELQKERYPQQQMTKAYVVSNETARFESQVCVYQNKLCKKLPLTKFELAAFELIVHCFFNKYQKHGQKTSQTS